MQSRFKANGTAKKRRGCKMGIRGGDERFIKSFQKQRSRGQPRFSGCPDLYLVHRAR